MAVTVELPSRGESGVVSPLLARGDWDNGTTYSISDLVQYAGSSYYAIVGNAASPPPSSNWQLLASNGTNGWTAPAVLTYGATVTPDLATSLAFTLAATGDFTLATPSNPSAGATFWIEITQDATGSRAITFSSDYKFSGGIAPLLSIAPNARDMLYCVIVASGRIASSLVRDLAAGA